MHLLERIRAPTQKRPHPLLLPSPPFLHPPSFQNRFTHAIETPPPTQTARANQLSHTSNKRITAVSRSNVYKTQQQTLVDYKELKGKVGGAAEGARKAAGKAGAKIGGAASEAGKSVGGAVSGAGKSIKGAASGGGKSAGGAGKFVGKSVGGAADKSAGGVKSAAGTRAGGKGAKGRVQAASVRRRASRRAKAL